MHPMLFEKSIFTPPLPFTRVGGAPPGGDRARRLFIHPHPTPLSNFQQVRRGLRGSGNKVECSLPPPILLIHLSSEISGNFGCTQNIKTLSNLHFTPSNLHSSTYIVVKTGKIRWKWGAPPLSHLCCSSWRRDQSKARSTAVSDLAQYPWRIWTLCPCNILIVN